MKIIPYILYLLLIALYITILSDLISIFGVGIDLIILLVVAVGLFKSETEAIWFGIAAGIISGSVRLDLMPWEVLIIGVTAAAVNQIGSRINLESLMSKILVLAGAVLFHGIIFSLVVSTDSFFFVLIRFIIPSMVYTVLLGLIFFLIKDGRITWANIKALF